jgi:2-polyprenyl-3-methyl-5-hydroxy-6-metoxy-1,4-benzoquinol methylase
MPKTKDLKRDKDEFDTTQLKLGSHGRTLHRDYTAHFFRWSFARRFITPKDNVLEIGCGEEKPLSKIITGGAAAGVKSYVGVDINKLKSSNNQRLTFYGETDFTKPAVQKRLLKDHGPFDVVVHMEVIEHMPVPAGRKLLKGCFELLRPGGTMLLSTPCYDGRRHAANHIHEYTVPELQKEIEKKGFEVVRRFGTFMDIKYIGKAKNTLVGTNDEWNRWISAVKNALGEYFDNDALSNIFGPLYPDHARNNLWVCRKPEVK